MTSYQREAEDAAWKTKLEARKDAYQIGAILQTLSKEKEHPVVKLLIAVQMEYAYNRCAYVDGNKMEHILRFFGATDEDFINLEYSGNFLAKDPTLEFRESRNGRFLIDFGQQTVSRLEFQPFVLSKEEDFVRDDSGLLRHFRGIQDNVQNNRAFQGLLKFQACVLEGIEILKRPNLRDGYDKWVSTVFQLRTITTPSLVGEPAKEGVHSDGVDHTMTTLLYTQNMTENSAVTQIHSNSQQTGLAWDKVNKEHVVREFQHRHFLDTVLIVDSELKHTVTPVYAFDNYSKALRDMMIFFTRRPKAEAHSTFKYDSLNAHPEIPQHFTIA